METAYAIVAENVSKSYQLGLAQIEEIFLQTVKKNQEIVVLKNVNFKIQKGSITGIIGENGSGKSTLLKTIGNIIKPDTGRISINGKVGSIIELGAGFHPDLTGYDNIFFNASLYGYSKKDILPIVEEIISFSELGQFINEPIKHYSSGMMMRLAFSIIIKLPFDILLLDEVFSVGDQNFKSKCIKKLQELSREQKTILIVSHDFTILKNICHELIFFYENTIYKKGEISDVIESYVIQTQIITNEVSFIDNQYFWNSPQNQIINQINLSTSDLKYTFKNTEPISFSLVLDKKTDEEIFPIIIFKQGRDLSFMACSNLANSANSNINLQGKGIFKLMFEIPSHFLNEGLYLIDLHIMNNDGKSMLLIENMCQIHVDNIWKKSFPILKENNYAGPVFLKTKWKLA